MEVTSDLEVGDARVSVYVCGGRTVYNFPSIYFAVLLLLLVAIDFMALLISGFDADDGVIFRKNSAIARGESAFLRVYILFHKLFPFFLIPASKRGIIQLFGTTTVKNLDFKSFIPSFQQHLFVLF